jgi:isopenicillin-N epimerase
MSVTPAAARHTFGHAMLAHWTFDPVITYLNHGTVGAVPRRVQQAQQAIRDEMERQPARFCVRELADVGEFVMRMPPRMRTAAAAIAAFVGCDAKDLAFVDNVTTGYNAVLRSWPFQAGDEILITDHCYGTVGYTADFVARRFGAGVTKVTLPFQRTWWPRSRPRSRRAHACWSWITSAPRARSCCRSPRSRRAAARAAW